MGSRRRDTGLELIYEDDYLLAVEKPGGLLTMSAGRGEKETAYKIVTDYVRSKKPGRGRGSDRVFIVHRLDRDTSGILLFAKTEETKRALQDDWNNIVLERKYIAVVEGIPAKKEGTLISWLRDNPSTMTVTSSPFDNRGKKAVTHYKVLREMRATDADRGHRPAISRSADYALVEFDLETGRKNQIRVHAAEMGHPVAGDRKYGARTNPLGRLALHAMTIAFIHPATGKTMKFTTRLPKSFKKLH